MGRRNDHSRDEIRQLALQAAQQLVQEQGLRGLSARKIAAAIGYTVGSLYLVFDNLDDLILQLNAVTLDDLYQTIVDTAEQQQSAEATIVAISHAYLDFAQKHRYRWRAIFEHNFAQKNSIVPEWYQHKLLGMFVPLENALRAYLKKNDKALKHIAFVLWNSVHGICILALSGKISVVASYDVHDSIDILVKNYLTGLRLRYR